MRITEHTVEDRIVLEVFETELRRMLFNDLHWTSIFDKPTVGEFDPDEWWIDEVETAEPKDGHDLFRLSFRRIQDVPHHQLSHGEVGA